jgi:iron complex transport system permease protein
MGTFSGATWRGVLSVSLYLWPAILALVFLARPLNLLSVGEQSAFHLGVDVRKFKLFVYIVNSLLVGICVAGAGAIGFVGLVVPHGLRLIGGSEHRWLLTASAITGASFMVAADTLARTLVAPTELPVGVVTALIGVPVFLWLLLRSEELR